MSPNELNEGLGRLMVPHCTPEVNVFILRSPGNERHEDDFRVDFSVACFSEDEHGEHLSIVPFKGPDANDYYYKVVEINDFDLEEGAYIKDIDGWITATKKSVEEKTPLFALTFGTFLSDSAKAVYLHIRPGVRPEEAMYFLNEFAQKKLFGHKLEF